MSEKVRRQWCPLGKTCLPGPLSKGEGYYCTLCQWWHVLDRVPGRRRPLRP